jgi:MFS family permease
VITPCRRTHVRWWICLIVFLATAIIYSDRQFLSLLKSTLADQIHWTDTQFAEVNSCFLGAYAFGLLFFGRFIDRVGGEAKGGGHDLVLRRVSRQLLVVASYTVLAIDKTFYFMHLACIL